MNTDLINYLGLDGLSDAEAESVRKALKDYFGDVIITTSLSSLKGDDLKKLGDALRHDDFETFEKMMGELAAKDPDLTRTIKTAIAANLSTLKKIMSDIHHRHPGAA